MSSSSHSEDKSSSRGEEGRKRKKSTTQTQSRATLEKERRQQIRARILDLRDQLPHFTHYLSEAESAKDVKLTREMTMVQTLEITVHLLDELLKDQRFLPGAGLSLRGASAGSSRQVHQFTAPKTSTRLSDESRRIGDGSKSKSRSKSRSGSQGGREG